MAVGPCSALTHGGLLRFHPDSPVAAADARRVPLSIRGQPCHVRFHTNSSEATMVWNTAITLMTLS